MGNPKGGSSPLESAPGKARPPPATLQGAGLTHTKQGGGADTAPPSQGHQDGWLGGNALERLSREAGWWLRPPINRFSRSPLTSGLPKDVLCGLARDFVG